MTAVAVAARFDLDAGRPAAQPASPAPDPPAKDLSSADLSSADPGLVDRSLTDRDEELAALAAARADVRGGEASILLIQGPAGLGKTVLLRTLAGTEADDGALVLRARGAEVERGFPFGVVRQLFEPVLAAASPAERDELLSGPAAPARRLLDSVAVDGPDADPDADVPYPVLHGLFRLAADLGARQRLLLVIDDAQHADLPSLRWLVYLIQRLDRSAQVLLGEFAAHPACRTGRPRPLSAAGTAELARRHFQAPADPGFAGACWQVAGGNPFLTQALLQGLADAGVSPVAAEIEASAVTATWCPRRSPAACAGCRRPSASSPGPSPSSTDRPT